MRYVHTYINSAYVQNLTWLCDACMIKINCKYQLINFQLTDMALYRSCIYIYVAITT